MKIKTLIAELQDLDPEIEIALDSDDMVIPAYTTSVVTTVEGNRYLVFAGDNYCEEIKEVEQDL
jgi:hypothetical protein